MFEYSVNFAIDYGKTLDTWRDSIEECHAAMERSSLPAFGIVRRILRKGKKPKLEYVQIFVDLA